jgi:hypothetical protein
MDRNHGAAGDPADEDVFGPVEDGEEVFEWIDDQDGADDVRGWASEPRPPAPTVRERLAAARAGGRRLRQARREIGVTAVVLLLACAAGGAGTSWFDGVAGAADRGDVVSLAVDSVVDGDPAASSYNAGSDSAVGQYVVEVANNSPAAVTLDSVSVDAGTLMSSTAWKPLGPSARIPAGHTAKVALTLRLFCPMVILSQQSGIFLDSAGTGGSASLPFPAVHVQAHDADGAAHDLVLPTRATTSGEPADTRQDFRGPGTPVAPEIVSADPGACDQYVVNRGTPLAGGGVSRYPGNITFAYDKVLSTSGMSFVLGFTVKNQSNHPQTVSTQPEQAAMDDNGLHTVWLPQTTQIAPGQSTYAKLTVHILGCTSILTGTPVLGETMLEVQDTTDGMSQPAFVDQALTGSLRLAGDIVHQEKAACS